MIAITIEPPLISSSTPCAVPHPHPYRQRPWICTSTTTTLPPLSIYLPLPARRPANGGRAGGRMHTGKQVTRPTFIASAPFGTTCGEYHTTHACPSGCVVRHCTTTTTTTVSCVRTQHYEALLQISHSLLNPVIRAAPPAYCTIESSHTVAPPHAGSCRVLFFFHT